MSEGWTSSAICGFLGNSEHESGINPGRYEVNRSKSTEDLGYGLVQWTPNKKLQNWADSNNKNMMDIELQIDRILFEVESIYLQWDYTKNDFNMTFEQFTNSAKDAKTLAKVFLNSYEQPAESVQPARGIQAEYWFVYFN